VVLSLTESSRSTVIHWTKIRKGPVFWRDHQSPDRSISHFQINLLSMCFGLSLFAQLFLLQSIKCHSRWALVISRL